MLLTIVSFIFVFGIIVFAHELGHFLTARLNGIMIHEFSIGMGPVVFKKQGRETLYALRAFPIGGYVRMEGEDESSEDPRSFTNKKPWQRLIVLAAGATMNFVLAYVLLVVLMFGMGSASNTLAAVLENSPAEKAGLLADDTIISINNITIDSWEEIIEGINLSEGNAIEIEVERSSNGSTDLITFVVEPVSDGAGSYKIGIQTKLTKQVDKAFTMAAIQFKAFFTDIFKFFANIGSKEAVGQLVGPVGLVNIIGEASKQGIWNLIFLAAYISVNLGIVNLLPFPALDGGRIVFVVVEMVLGRPVNREKEGYVHFIGLVLLMGLMAFLVFKDIQRF